uniref:spermatogenesis-associated protein 7-like n=1 Tax=Ciona intestinalis TaxID=7719 RepID=UPI000180B598|nr:spermatogenesis-associated protein 7-like [Ciona intestinalis]|eukprot:XP_009861671.1 spermatogenesis-associated protein 7-like [Ciona intestinalis]
MKGQMKGHMALNSSPYKPSTNKLSSQYLIKDQMLSHYHNLATIKSAVDHHPPKSTQQSIKKRDQLRRDGMLLQSQTMNQTKYSMTPQSEPNMMSSRGRNQHKSRSEPKFSPRSDPMMEKYYDEEYNTSSRSWSPNHFMETGKSRPSTARPSTARSRGDLRSTNRKNATMKSPRQQVMDVTYNGDYLERHEERFNKTEKPFTPRTKKRPGKSFLSQSKHYSAPTLPKADKEKKKREKKEEDAKTKLEALDASGNYDDDDHSKWVEQQAEFVKKMSLMDGSMRRERDWMETKSFGSSQPTSMGYSETMRRIKLEEEELKYCEFINEVTNDILTKGIYSDQILNQLMDRHLNSSHGLERERLERMLRQLKVDLGISTARSTSSFGRFDTKSSKNDRFSDTEDKFAEKIVISDIPSNRSSPKSNRKLNTLNSKSTESDENVFQTSDKLLSDPIDSENLSITLKPHENLKEVNEAVKSEEEEIVDDADELDKTATTKQNSTDGSDYESVAALSMVIRQTEANDNQRQR